MSDSVSLLQKIHKAFLGFSLRAEKTDHEDLLVKTFVDSAPLLDLIESSNSQIIYGRRGTGKTHALKYVANSIIQRGEQAIYIDLRSVGSNTSIYNNFSRSLSQRASLLINDVLEAILNNLYPIAVAALDNAPDGNQITLRLDDFQASLSEIRIHGAAENTQTVQMQRAKKHTSGIHASITTATLNAEREDTISRDETLKTSATGQEFIHVDFGRIQSSLEGLLPVMNIKRLWVFIDEWSEIPLELQPYLADLIRRTFLPTTNVIVKIASIEHRSSFSLSKGNGEYIGLELGADISANLTLDDYLVFDSNEQKSIQFFKRMIFNHYKVSDHFDSAVSTEDQLVQIAFTQQNAFIEFVRAVEGVPRDALNLCAVLATKAFGQKISINDVTSASLDWYQRDKAVATKSDEILSNVLMIIINEVIGERRSRAFLFSNMMRHPMIERLFDARLLHILKKNISSKDEPGVRYDVFKIDYGCYVSLRNTDKAPLGLFQADDEYIEVPRDDYRSIRRAILPPELLNEVTSSVRAEHQQ